LYPACKDLKTGLKYEWKHHVINSECFLDLLGRFHDEYLFSERSSRICCLCVFGGVFLLLSSLCFIWNIWTTIRRQKNWKKQSHSRRSHKKSLEGRQHCSLCCTSYTLLRTIKEDGIYARVRHSTSNFVRLCQSIRFRIALQRFLLLLEPSIISRSPSFI